MTTPWQPGFQGVTVVPPGYNDPHNWSPASTLQLVASTGAAGYTLVNGTGTVISWTAPNDGQMHRVVIISTLHVTSLETGGAIGLNNTVPDGTADNFNLFAAGAAAGVFRNPSGTQLNIQAGSTVAVVQTSALTAGGPSLLWADIWAT